MTINHAGIHTQRLQREPKENAFAQEWAKFAPDNLATLVNESGTFAAAYSERDALIAATIIQWLGSPVGEEFVNSVRGSSQYKKATV